MAHVVAIGTYLPPWEQDGERVAGPDEDALTMAVAAGRVADRGATATRVVMVTRNFPLLEGGSGGVLVAALSLAADVPVTEVLGGGPAVLDQITQGEPGTLVIAADETGGAAVLLGRGGTGVAPVARQNRSLPVVVRQDNGAQRAYNDPRLLREAGVGVSLSRLGITGSPALAAVSGTKAAQLKDFSDTADALESAGSSGVAAVRLLADAVEAGRSGMLVAVEQANVAVAELADGHTRITRDEPDVQPMPKFRTAPGNGIPLSLASYARAFEPKIRWEAAVFDGDADGPPLFPPRVRVDAKGAIMTYRMQPLPRSGTVYTQASIAFPVPDLPSPYALALIQLDGSPVRVLLKVTGAPLGVMKIGDRGSVVFRRIAMRTGIPDYGYMFWPGKEDVTTGEGAVA